MFYPAFLALMKNEITKVKDYALRDFDWNNVPGLNIYHHREDTQKLIQEAAMVCK